VELRRADALMLSQYVKRPCTGFGISAGSPNVKVPQL
jgi:hypothetical protein